MLDPVLNESDIYREWAPPPAWRSVVACCWEQRVVAERVQRVVPDGCGDLLFFGAGGAQVVGMADEVALPSLSAGSWIRGVRIRPEAVAATFGVEGSELRNQTVDLADVVGSRRSRALVADDVMDTWIRSIEPDARVSVAVRLVEHNTVDATATKLGLSGRQLRRIFEVNVGIGPKSFQRVLRFQRFLQRAEVGAPLASAAFEAGYSDQAHMSRDVRGLSGLTPGRLIAERVGS
jgi:AraC-like DNA-binding protein